MVGLTGVFLCAGSVLAGVRKPWAITRVAIDPLDASILYAVARVPPQAGAYATIDRIFRSDDRGVTWRPITTPTFDVPYPDGFRYITAMAVDPQISGVVYAAAGTEGAFTHSEVTWTELFKSADGGESWTSVLGFSNTSPLISIAIDPTTSSTVYVGIASIPGSQAILKSVNGGADWLDVSPRISEMPGYPPFPEPEPDAVQVLGIDPFDPAVIYAGGGSIPVYRSPDAASTWAPDSSGFPDLPFVVVVSAFGVAPSGPTTLYAGTFDQGMYVSGDSGAHWVAANAGITGEIRCLAVDPRSSAVAYTGTQDGLYKTSNRGAQWSSIGFRDAAINAIAIDPFSPDTVYLGTSQGAFKSVDAGSHWTQIDEGMHPVPLVIPVEPVTVAPVRGRP